MDSTYWARRTAQQNTSRRRFLAGTTIAGAGLAAVALVGCGDDDDDDPTTTATATGTGTGTATATGTAAGTPKRGGIISASTQNGPPDNDPHGQSTSLVHYTNVGPAYGRLLKFEVGPDVPIGQPLPTGDLAEDWEQPDDTTYVFRMRPNAKWHNIVPVNGRTANADDIKFSWERQLALKVATQYLSDVETIEVVDPATLRVNLKAPSVDAIVHLASALNKIVAKEVVDQYGDLKTAPVIGTGPWVMESIQGGTYELSRNPDYYTDEGGPYADGLKFTRIDDQATVLASFRTGAIQFASVNKLELDSLRDQDGDITSTIHPNYCFGINVNHALPQFSDLRARQGLSLALNRQAIIDTIWFGAATWTTSIAALGPREMSEQQIMDLLKYDPAEAARLIEEAGVDGDSYEMSVWNNAQSLPAGELVAPSIQAAGLTPNLLPVDNVQALARYGRGDGLQAHFGAWTNHASPTLDLRSRFITGGVQNGPKLSDPELDAMIEAQSQEFEEDARDEILLDIQRKILTDVLVWIPLIRSTITTALQPQVRNWQWAPFQATEVWTPIWLDA